MFRTFQPIKSEAKTCLRKTKRINYPVRTLFDAKILVTESLYTIGEYSIFMHGRVDGLLLQLVFYLLEKLGHTIELPEVGKSLEFLDFDNKSVF